MFLKTPTEWIPNWSEDATNITVPIASFPELTAAEADGATGDIRKIVFAVMEKLATKFASLDPADRPTRMTITKGSALNAQTNEITATYIVTLTLAPASLDVAAE